ncbi:MAG: hypothetical protein K2K06_03875 [Oscillospiraceae bacterium]|nr:hypothetical protein [Oscillospiraceae bacterium]
MAEQNVIETLSDVQKTIVTLYNSEMLARDEEEILLLKAFRKLNETNKINTIFKLLLVAQTEQLDK